jgi:hypothetical protein
MKAHLAAMMEVPYHALSCMPISTRNKIVATYLLFLGASFFLWPVSLGIPLVPLRVVWIVFALPLIFLSAQGLSFALREAAVPAWNLRHVPWWLLALVIPVLSYPLVTVPLRTFSDEILIAMPSLAFGYVLAEWFSWPGLMVVALGAAGMAIFVIRKAPLSIVRLILTAMAALAILLALFAPHTISFVNRFPPVVHLLGSLSVLLTAGSVHLLRLPNLIWTLVAMLAIWHMRPEWNVWHKSMLFVGLLLGPLGWMFHITLYQACGEVTLALIAVFLTTTILRQPHARLAGYLGMTLSLWMLYRPTSFIAALTIVGLLFLSRKWREAWQTAWIFLPISLLWIALYPLYNTGYLLQGDSLFPAAKSVLSLLVPIRAFLFSLPYTLHQAVLIMAILLTAWTEWRGAAEQRTLLRVAWVVTLVTSLSQHLITLPILYGYVRFSNLLAVPVAIAFSGLFQTPFTIRRRLACIAALLLFIVATPFDAVRFAQTILQEEDVIHTFTAGADVPLPFTNVALDIVSEHPQTVLLVPDSALLELAVATRRITTEQRKAIILRSEEWQLGDTDRPVIIQAPSSTYLPTITAAWEKRLRAARTWALEQPGSSRIRLGVEEAIIVP